MNKWFKEVKNVEELRKKYKELLKKFHPDNGGNVSDMQEINAEFDRLFAILSEEEQADEQSSTYNKNEENEAFKEVLNKIIHINADVEIIGSWIWVHGGYAYKEMLKEIGFKFAPKKKCWTWHYGEYCRRSKREISLDEIRQKYGSEKVNRKTKQYVLN